MSKESYPKKLGKQIKQSYDDQMKNRAILNDANLSSEEKKAAYYSEAEGARKTKYTNNIDRLSRPVENYMDDRAGRKTDEGETDANPEASDEGQSPQEPFGEDLNNNAGINHVKRKESEQNETLGDSISRREREQNETPSEMIARKELEQQGKFREAEGKTPGFEEGAGKSFDIGKRTPGRPGNDELMEQGKTVAKGEAKQAAKQAFDQAINAVKKLAVKTVKKFALSLAANPITWIVMGGIVLAGLIFLLIWSMYGGMANKSPNPAGGTIVRAVDPIADKNWIQKLLSYSGDRDLQTKLSQEMLDGLKSDLSNLENDAAASNEVKAKIAAANQAIANFNPTTPDRNKALAIVAAVDEILKAFWYVAPLPNEITTQAPFKDLSSLSYNFNPHLGTVGNPCGGSTGQSCEVNPNLPARTYMQFVQNTCDAVDLKINDGTDVYPVFAGKVIKDDPKSQGVWIQDQSSNYIAVYAHMSPQNVKVGDTVGLDKVIGKVGSGHLHFELAAKNHCVVMTPGETQANNNAVGKYLWSKMATVLHLN